MKILKFLISSPPPPPRCQNCEKNDFSIEYIYQIKPLGLVSTKNFFWNIGGRKGSGGVVGNEKWKIAFSPTWLASRRVCKMLFCTSTLFHESFIKIARKLTAGKPFQKGVSTLYIMLEPEEIGLFSKNLKNPFSIIIFSKTKVWDVKF